MNYREPSSAYTTTLEVGDRVAMDILGGRVWLGTVRVIELGSAANLGSRVSFRVEWDHEPGKETKGWLRHALRKIPRSAIVPKPVEGER